MKNNIGLVISGIKGGFKVICSEGVVNIHGASAANVIDDLRRDIIFNQSKLDVYSLQITNGCKVFTLSRSLNRQGTGDYVAISLLVPHTERVTNVREVLKAMMDAYVRQSIHPLYGTYRCMVHILSVSAKMSRHWFKSSIIRPTLSEMIGGVQSVGNIRTTQLMYICIKSVRK